MKDTFNIRRFGRYLRHDLTNAWNNCTVSILVMGLMPVLYYILCFILNIVFGTTDESTMSMSERVGIFVTVFAVGAISMPVRLYGQLTDRKTGSAWLMVPASKLEKFLSMLVVILVALPLALSVLAFGSDAILSMLDKSYGSPFLALVAEHGFTNLPVDGGSVTVVLPSFIYFFWCTVALVFLLGGLCFKKSKVGKTILVIFGFNLVLTILIATFTPYIDLTEWFLSEKLNDLEVVQVVRRINVTVTVIGTAVLAVLSGCIYARLSTLKH